MHEMKIPKRRLIISDAAIPYVARGGRIFGKQVIDADIDIEEGETVLVVDDRGHPLGIAQAAF